LRKIITSLSVFNPPRLHLAGWHLLRRQVRLQPFPLDTPLATQLSLLHLGINRDVREDGDSGIINVWKKSILDIIKGSQDISHISHVLHGLRFILRTAEILLTSGPKGFV
jgi:hypothetical protein